MTYTSDVRILMGMAHSHFSFITQITEQSTEEIKTAIFVSLSFSPKISLFHDQSPPSTSFDSRIFENVTTGHGTSGARGLGRGRAVSKQLRKTTVGSEQESRKEIGRGV
jgi:hypothetical protein